MADAWDDSDDDWDKDDDDELDSRLQKVGIGGATAAPAFDEEEDLALKEKEIQEKQMNQELKKKGNALMEKKLAEQERMMEEEVTRKAMELEAELEATMTPDELKKMRQQQIEDADHALTDDLFGSIDNKPKGAKAGAGSGSDVLVLKDLKDHLKHAKKVGAAIKVRAFGDRNCSCL
jgi:translation initiation factor 3 subunit J